MLKISENEYKQLKNELEIIKTCITRYIGYIISVAGLAALIAKFIADSHDIVEYSIVVVIIALIVITMLFEVLWYKFISHNRYVGYIQLLVQEIGFHELEDIYKNDRTNKPYLFKKPKFDFPINKSSIYTWEYIMSRYNNSKKYNPDGTKEVKIAQTAPRSFFDFSIPSHYETYKKTIYAKKIDAKFFKKIILPIYERKYKPVFYQGFLKDAKKSLHYLYLRDKDYKIRFDNLKIDGNYYVNGWTYPLKIMQIVFLAIILLMIFALVLLPFIKFNTNQNIFNLILNYRYFIAIFCFLSILGFWVRRYVINIPQLMNGANSIDNYCWTFFHFRVQYLNAINIIPVYFSRSFLRYFKSHLYELKSNEYFSALDGDTNLSCERCNPGQNNLFKLKGDPKFVICKGCFEKYKDQLAKGHKFDNYLEPIHSKLKSIVKKEFDK